MKRSLVLGADIGGSHITSALVDLESRSIVEGSFSRTHVDSSLAPADIITQWSEGIRASLGVQQDVPVHMAMPGPFDYEAGISHIKGQHKYDALYGLNVKELLSESLSIPVACVKMDNDAACFLQGELFAGALKGQSAGYGFTLGTGLGSAMATDGKASSLELWQTPFLDGIAEDYFSARWIIGRYHELTGHQAVNVKAIADAAAHEPAAADVFRTFGANLGEFVSTLQPLPEMVLLGGNIAKTFNWFQPSLQEVLAKKGLNITFVLSQLGEYAAIYGAASL